MDREECPVLIHSGDDHATTCMFDAPLSDSPHAELCDPPHTDNDANPADSSDVAPVIEALLFSSDTPLSAARLADLAGGGSVTKVRLHLAALNDKYTAAGLSFRIVEIAHGYQMQTLPQFQPWLAKLNRHQAQNRLSAAALETLSIVAYKQPVIRADIEAIRGVSCGEVLNRLREMGLVKIVDRAEIIGRPILYGTTRRFLDLFGLGDLDDLPPMEMLTLRRTTPNRAASSVAADPPPEAVVAVAGA